MDTHTHTSFPNMTSFKHHLAPKLYAPIEPAPVGRSVALLRQQNGVRTVGLGADHCDRSTGCRRIRRIWRANELNNNSSSCSSSSCRRTRPVRICSWCVSIETTGSAVVSHLSSSAHMERFRRCFGTAAAAAAVAIVANVRMETLLVGHVFHRLYSSVRQQNVILAARDARVRVAVLRVPKVVSGVRITHSIAELVAGRVLVLFESKIGRIRCDSIEY